MPPTSKTKGFHVKPKSITRVKLMLVAVKAFQDVSPRRRRYAFLIPRNKEAWLQFLVTLLKKKTVIKYLTDTELKKVITRSRRQIQTKEYTYTRDPDTPACVFWTEAQVADWIEEFGYPHLKDAFLQNCINGRRLVNVDASALNKMGMKDFDEIKNVASGIRSLLELNRPNMLRAIARKVPLKLYLRERSHTGRTYDLLTFESFCKANGFPYDVVAQNKCALIDCTASVLIHPPHVAMDSSEESGGSSEDKSLASAASVEFVVRHQIIRNKTIDSIMEDLLSRYWDPKYKEMYDRRTILQKLIDAGFAHLGFIGPENYTKEKLKFATGVAEELIKELLRTVDVLNDMNQLRDELRKADVLPEYFDVMREAAKSFLEDALPITASLLLGYYNLENIFRDQPEFVEFVNSIADEAEGKVNELVPTAEKLVDSVISEAELRVLAPEASPEALHIVIEMENHE